MIMQNLGNNWIKRTINWNKYQSKVAKQAQNLYLDYLIELNFEGVNIFVVLSFEYNDKRQGHTGYFILSVEIKD